MEDRRGLLWLGLVRHYPVQSENEKSIQFLILRLYNRSHSLNNITKIIEDNRYIWCATADGLLKMKPEIKPDDSRINDFIFKKGIESVLI